MLTGVSLKVIIAVTVRWLMLLPVSQTTNFVATLQVGLEQPLMEAGLESLAAVELRTNLGNQLGVELPATLIFDYPSIATLADYLTSTTAAITAPVRFLRRNAGIKVLCVKIRTSYRITRNCITGCTPILQWFGAQNFLLNAQVQPGVPVGRPAVDVLPKVYDIVKRQLGSAVSYDAPLMEAGLDSLGATELRNTLSEAFAAELPATAVFDYPSITSLAAFISSVVQPPSRAVPSGSAVVELEDGVVVMARSAAAANVRGHTTHVIGWSGRYPGAGQGLVGFWSSLTHGEDLPSVVPLQRWDANRMYSPDARDGTVYARLAVFIDNIASFDASLYR